MAPVIGAVVHARLTVVLHIRCPELMAVRDLDASMNAINQAEQLLSTYDHGVDEPEEYARIRAKIEYKAEMGG